MKILACIVSATLALPFCTMSADGLSQREVLAVVLRENPRLNAARAKWEMMKKRVPQAKAWEDPMVGVDVERIGTTKFNTFTDNEWMASQSVPLTGKNLVRGRIANAEALATFEELRRAKLDAISRARSAYFRLASAHGELMITHENQDLLQQFAEISRVKYEAGIQSQSDVLLAQTELARLGQTIADLEREISDQQTQLNVLMNRPASSALDRPEPLRFTALPLPREAIAAKALASRPEIIIAARSVDAEKSRRDLAKRQWIPDPQLRVEARQFNGSNGIDEYDTGVFFSVPWTNFSKYSAAVAETERSLEKAQREYEAARTEVLGLVRDQLKKIETAARNYELFSGKIVPLTRQAIESTRAGYESDKTGFLELITARRNLQDAESSALDQLAAHEVAISELEAIIGADSSVADATERKGAK